MALCVVVCVSLDNDQDSVAASSGVDGGIEWDYDTENKVLTIKPYASAENPGVMTDYPDPVAPWMSSVKTGATLVIESGVKNIGDNAFNNNGFGPYFAGGLTIPDSVTTIGDYAFAYCKSFEGGLTIGDNVETIGQYAFYYCKSFDGLTIGDNVETIGNHAFSECSGFSGDLVIPDKVTTIGQYAFDNCVGFDGGLTIGDNVETIGDHAFYICNKFTGDLIIPDKVTAIGQYAFFM